MNTMISNSPHNDEDIVRSTTLENGFAKNNYRKGAKTLFIGHRMLNRGF